MEYMYYKLILNTSYTSKEYMSGNKIHGEKRILTVIFMILLLFTC